MILRLFKGTGPGVIFLIIVLFGLLWAGSFIDPQLPGRYIYETNPMPLYSIIKLLIGAAPLPGLIFSFVILSVLLVTIVNFNTTVFFISERTFLPAIFYLIFSAIFPKCQVLTPVLPAAFLLLLALMRIMDAYRKPGIAFNFFDASLLISIGSLFYANLIWFGLLVIIGIALLRTGNIREIFISILGLITPYILTAGIYYVLGQNLDVLYSDIVKNLFGDNPDFSFSKLAIIAIIFSSLLILISIIFLIGQINSKKIKSRKTFYLLLWGFLVSLIIYFALPSVSVEIVWIIGIPASYFLAHYFVFVKKKIVTEILFSVFLLLIILLQVLFIFR
jgi:hypothetical protein